jgi:hypothetical protein
VLVEQGDGDGGPVREPAVQGALADAGRPGDVLHGHVAGAAGGEQLLGRGQDAATVAGRVGALAPLEGGRGSGSWAAMPGSSTQLDGTST